MRPKGLALHRRRPCRPSPGDQLCDQTARSASDIPRAPSRHRSQHRARPREVTRSGAQAAEPGEGGCGGQAGRVASEGRLSLPGRRKDVQVSHVVLLLFMAML